MPVPISLQYCPHCPPNAFHLYMYPKPLKLYSATHQSGDCPVGAVGVVSVSVPPYVSLYAIRSVLST
jgi:hypothetical protein